MKIKYTGNKLKESQNKIDSSLDEFEEINKEIDKVISKNEEFPYLNKEIDLQDSMDSIDSNFLNYISSKPKNLLFNGDIDEAHNHNEDPMNNNNSFSYTCPYVQSNSNPFHHFDFPQLNQLYCPHMPSNCKNQMNNSKKYSKRKIECLDLPKNQIHLDNILKMKDKRTTIIIRHIPNKYTLDILIQELNTCFLNKFDAIYLPIDFAKNSNLGFGFINLIDPIHLIYFYDEFIGKQWNLFNSNKQCQLAYAKIQGKDALTKYYEKSIGSAHLNDLKNKSFYLFVNNISQREIPMKYYEIF